MDYLRHWFIKPKESKPQRRMQQAGEYLKDAGYEVKEAVKEKAGETYDTVKDKAGQAYDTAKDKAGQAYDTVKDKAGEAAERLKYSGQEAYDTAKDKAGEAAERLKYGTQEAYDKAKDKAGEAADRLKYGTQEAYDTAKDKAEYLADRTKYASQNAINKARNAGEDVADSARLGAQTAKDTLREGVFRPSYTHEQWTLFLPNDRGAQQEIQIRIPSYQMQQIGMDDASTVHMPLASIAYLSLFTLVVWFGFLFRGSSRVTSVASISGHTRLPEGEHEEEEGGKRKHFRSRSFASDEGAGLTVRERVVAATSRNLVSLDTIILNTLSLLQLCLLESSGVFRNEMIHTFSLFIVGGYMLNVLFAVLGVPWIERTATPHGKWLWLTHDASESLQWTSAGIVSLWCLAFALLM